MTTWCEAEVGRNSRNWTPSELFSSSKSFFFLINFFVWGRVFFVVFFLDLKLANWNWSKNGRGGLKVAIKSTLSCVRFYSVATPEKWKLYTNYLCFIIKHWSQSGFTPVINFPTSRNHGCRYRPARRIKIMQHYQQRTLSTPRNYVTARNVTPVSPVDV